MADKPAHTDKAVLTSALEDYLETVYELVQESKVARVRDIAKARGVRAGSVTPAMKRLAALGLIKYVQREYIDLTPQGEAEARKIYSRHRALTRFFNEILGMKPEQAQRDACSMEHSLSAEGMDHLVRFFEFLQMCPDGQRFLKRFRGCDAVKQGGDRGACLGDRCSHRTGAKRRRVEPLTSMPAGHQLRVAQLGEDPEARKQLLDLGVLPGMQIDLVRQEDDFVIVRFQGAEHSFASSLAASVFVHEIS